MKKRKVKKSKVVISRRVLKSTPRNTIVIKKSTIQKVRGIFFNQERGRE